MEKPPAKLRVAPRQRIIEKDRAKALGLAFTPLNSDEQAPVGWVRDRSTWVELPIAERWILALRVGNQRGHPIISEIRLFPDTEKGQREPGEWRGIYDSEAEIPRGGITASHLRELRVGPFRAALRNILAVTPAKEMLRTLGAPWVDFNAPAVSSKPGPKGRSDFKLARMASVYEAAHRAGRPPIPSVAARFHLSLSKARDVIRRARERGLLTGAEVKGLGGGGLTDRAKAILKKSARPQKKGGKTTHATR